MLLASGQGCTLSKSKCPHDSGSSARLTESYHVPGTVHFTYMLASVGYERSPFTDEEAETQGK